jgi:glycosyltransferase involved in cell wall biosynthesis
VAPQVIVVAGKDPLNEPGGGHSAYVRAHGYAAVHGGFDPQIVCLGRSTCTVVTGFGTVHRHATPLRPVRQLLIEGHARRLAGAVIELANRSTDDLTLVHGFGVWSYGGLLAVRELRSQGRRASLLVSSYTTYRDEAVSHLRGERESFLRRCARLAETGAIYGLVAPRERAAYRGADEILVNYQSVARLVRARFGPSVHVVQASYGPEAAFVSSDPMFGPQTTFVPTDPVGSPLVMSIASHHPRKGIDVFVEALGTLKRGGVPVRACIVGRGPLRGAHADRVGQLGLTDSVTFPPFVTELRPLLDQCEIFVLSTRAEQSGSLALLEAMAAGKAIVASAVDGIIEDVADREDGLLVAPGNAQALADALRELLGDPALRRRLGANAARTFARRFSAEPFAAALGAAYRRRGLFVAASSESGATVSRPQRTRS